MFGWDFSLPNWIPNSLIIQENLHQLYLMQILDDDDCVDDHKEVRDLHITVYQEYIYSLVDAVKRVLDEDQCLTVGHGLYAKMEKLLDFVDNLEWTEIEKMHSAFQEKIEEVNRRLSDLDIDTHLPFRNEEDIIEEQIYDDQYEYDLNEVDLPGLRPGESPIAYERRLNAISQTEREDNNE